MNLECCACNIVVVRHLMYNALLGDTSHSHILLIEEEWKSALDCYLLFHSGCDRLIQTGPRIRLQLDSSLKRDTLLLHNSWHFFWQLLGIVFGSHLFVVLPYKVGLPGYLLRPRKGLSVLFFFHILPNHTFLRKHSLFQTLEDHLFLIGRSVCCLYKTFLPSWGIVNRVSDIFLFGHNQLYKVKIVR